MKMITKEIDVWIDGSDLEKCSSINGFKQVGLIINPKYHHSDLNKAKLIIEIPEKVRELTKAEFHSIWQEVNGCTWKNEKEAELYKGLKEKLFGNSIQTFVTSQCKEGNDE